MNSSSIGAIVRRELPPQGQAFLLELEGAAKSLDDVAASAGAADDLVKRHFLNDRTRQTHTISDPARLAALVADMDASMAHSAGVVDALATNTSLADRLASTGNNALLDAVKGLHTVTSETRSRIRDLASAADALETRFPGGVRRDLRAGHAFDSGWKATKRAVEKSAVTDLQRDQKLSGGNAYEYYGHNTAEENQVRGALNQVLGSADLHGGAVRRHPAVEPPAARDIARRATDAAATVRANGASLADMLFGADSNTAAARRATTLSRADDTHQRSRESMNALLDSHAQDRAFLEGITNPAIEA